MKTTILQYGSALFAAIGSVAIALSFVLFSPATMAAEPLTGAPLAPSRIRATAVARGTLAARAGVKRAIANTVVHAITTRTWSVTGVFGMATRVAMNEAVPCDLVKRSCVILRRDHVD